MTDHASGENKGHGHVHKRPDGVKARCGGPNCCPECSLDALAAEIERLTRERDEWRRGSAHVNERLLGEIERLTSAAASCCCSRCAGEIGAGADDGH